jgi:hypothetical protein
VSDREARLWARRSLVRGVALCGSVRGRSHAHIPGTAGDQPTLAYSQVSTDGPQGNACVSIGRGGLLLPCRDYCLPTIRGKDDRAEHSTDCHSDGRRARPAKVWSRVSAPSYNGAQAHCDLQRLSGRTRALCARPCTPSIRPSSRRDSRIAQLVCRMGHERKLSASARAWADVQRARRLASHALFHSNSPPCAACTRDFAGAYTCDTRSCPACRSRGFPRPSGVPYRTAASRKSCNQYSSNRYCRSWTKPYSFEPDRCNHCNTPRVAA